MRFAILAAVLVLCQQEKAEYELKWSIPAKTAAEYTISDLKGNKAFPRERPFVLFSADLNEDGGNNLIVNTFEELPLMFALQLPKEKVKKGQAWAVEKDLFEDARQALTVIHGYKPIAARGSMVISKAEMINDRECARIDGTFQFFDIKWDGKGNKVYPKTVVATLTTTAWVTLKDPLPVKMQFHYDGRISEYDGIKQGEEAKSVKVNFTHQYDLKKEGLKIDQVANISEIHAAIRKGAEWLRTQSKRGIWQDNSGSFAKDFPIGSTALCVMALLHSGVKIADPILQEGYKACLRAELRKVYDVAATIMMIETRYLPLEQYEEVKELTEEKARAAIAEKITPEDKAFLQRAVAYLLSKQTKLGTWGYPEEDDIKDNSNTQYALLGLKAAVRCGITVKSDVWKKILNYWLDSQKVITNPKVVLKLTWMDEKDPGFATRAEEVTVQGAWGYLVKVVQPELNPDKGYGSMVCAGLTSIIIAESELFLNKDLPDDLRKRIESCKKAGFAWLQNNYTVRGCPPAAGFWSVFHMYYLYSLERVGVLYGLKEVNGHDWYQEGALLLIRDQKSDGSWLSYDNIPVLDTAFALLFLKKATMKVATK